VEYRRILRIKPRFGMAWLALGQALESLGKTSEAEACYREAVANPVLSAKELTILARFCQSRGWLEAAATNYLRAVQCSAHDAALRLEAGQVLEKLGRHSDAAQCYAEAVRLAPRMAQARFLHGLSLGRSGKAAEAAEEFRAALRAMPGLVEARINLATALMHQGRYADALSEFEEVLKHSPDHPVALAQVQQLQGKLAKTTAH
jgi:protein O-GlcNAc transferase